MLNHIIGIPTSTLCLSSNGPTSQPEAVRYTRRSKANWLRGKTSVKHIVRTIIDEWQTDTRGQPRLVRDEQKMSSVISQSYRATVVLRDCLFVMSDRFSEAAFFDDDRQTEEIVTRFVLLVLAWVNIQLQRKSGQEEVEGFQFGWYSQVVWKRILRNYVLKCFWNTFIFF